jgi:hypothetical protein
MAAGRDGRHPMFSRGAPADWFEYRLEHHPEFLRRVAEARTAIREGQGVLLEELERTESNAD